MHGVTLLVMPALIFASGINEVALLRTCQQTYKDKSTAALSDEHVFIKVKATSQQGPAMASACVTFHSLFENVHGRL